MIPDEAIEAAMGAYLSEHIKRKGQLGAISLAVLAALEAAAPHLQSAAWERGVEDGYHHRPNPYKAD